MKKISVFFILSLIFIIGFSCKSLKKVDFAGLAEKVPTDTVAEAVTGGVDFKKDEVLCAKSETQSMVNNTYYAAKVLTPASKATKNQAKVLFLDGKEMWTNYVIPSHKATKAEMSLSKYVLFYGYGHQEEVSSDSYRKGGWYLGRITSTDDLYKDMIEIKGKKYYIKWVRIPEVKVK